MKIGVISDTHNFLDPKIPAIFRGVEHILHGGDIGLPWILEELEDIAPVTAVSGNTDTMPGYEETKLISLDGLKFLVHHIVDPDRPSETVQRRLAEDHPDVVIFGHTHKPFEQRRDQCLFLNPGYAGKQRFNLPRTVAILQIIKREISIDFRPL